MKTKKLIGSLKRGFMQKIRLPRWSFWAKSHRGEREVVESTSGENRPRDQSRAKFLRNAAAGLTGTVAGAVVAGLAGSSVVEAACGDPALLWHSGNTGDPNLAANATEVQFNGAVNPGVVFMAQADNSFTPSDDVLFPAALAGWTSTNPNIPNGVYGFMQHPNGHGVVGWSLNKNGVYGRSSNASGSGVFGENPGGGNGVVGTASEVFPVAGVWGNNFGDGHGVRGTASGLGVGGAFEGPNRAPLNLQPVMVNQPPAHGTVRGPLRNDQRR